MMDTAAAGGGRVPVQRGHRWGLQQLAVSDLVQNGENVVVAI